jgi:hypothetical protein
MKKHVLAGVLVVFCSSALAQTPLARVLTTLGINYRGDIGVQLETVQSDRLQQYALVLSSRLDLDTRLTFAETDLDLIAVTEPSMRFDSAETFLPDGNSERDFVSVNLGLSEAYGLTSQGAFDVSAGLERLPLEYARLSVPLNLEPVLAENVRRGLLGARANYFSGDYRARGGLFYDGFYSGSSDELGGFASVRRSFGEFELEGFGVYAGEPIVGVGGSGIVQGLGFLEDIVVYGEAWWLFDSRQARATFGATGNPSFGAWTLELAYLVPGLGSVKFEGADDGAGNVLTTDPRPAVLAQIDWPIDSEHSLTVSGASFFDDDGTRGQVSVIYSNLGFDDQLTASVTVLEGPEPLAVVGSVGVRYFF